tara:strand:+ start:197 stop:805 length:609 start_codon:yes stop_codon:yes gene_type:complete
MKPKIIIIGAGSHANSCVDVIELEKKYSIYGLIDEKKPRSIILKKYKYLGRDKDLKKIRKTIKYAIICVGFIHDFNLRNKIYLNLKKLKFKIPNIISPISYVSKKSKIGFGTMIFHEALINSNVTIGNNSIINTKSLIEHDVKIGNNCHISTGVIVNGNSKIGDNTFIGSGSVISNNVKIGKNCFIKMKSRVIKNVPNNTKI